MSKNNNKSPSDIEYSIWDTNTDKAHTTLPNHSTELSKKQSQQKQK